MTTPSDAVRDDTTLAVSRFDFNEGGFEQEHERGHYVRYSDYADLTRQLAEARDENARHADHAQELMHMYKGMRNACMAAEAALSEARRDAERYRWLRHGDHDEYVIRNADGSPLPILDPDVANPFLLRNEKLDAAIDAAMSGGRGTPPDDSTHLEGETT